MIDATMINLALLSCTCGLGWGIIAYSGYAASKGQVCGAWFAGDFSLLQGVGYVAILGSLIIAPIVGPWWHLVVVLLAGNILARVLFAVMGAKVQALLALGVFPLLVVTAWRVWQVL